MMPQSKRSMSPIRPIATKIDLVVFTGPQLSLFELKLVSELFDGRKVHDATQLIITTNRQNRDVPALSATSRRSSAPAGTCWSACAST